MKVTILKETGYDEAILGLSLSYNTTIENAEEVAARLYTKDGGHNKFLESICVWLDITAPRYWWLQFDTYRIGVTKQSESTMHTILRQPLTMENFVSPICCTTLTRLNELIEQDDFYQLKIELPEGFLQRRIVCTNYKALRHIVYQRWNHKLFEWQVFVKALIDLEYFEFVEA